MNAIDKTLVGEIEQRHAGRLVDAAALGLNDAILDLIRHAETVATTDLVRGHHEGDLVGKFLAIDRDGPTLVEANRDLFGFDRHSRIPMLHAHDRLNDVHRLGQKFERLGLVRRTPNIGVGRIRLLDAVAVWQVVRDEPLAHLFAATELIHELLVEPRLIDTQGRIDEQAVAVEALDVVALVRRAVAPNRDAILAHRSNQHRARDRATKRRRIEVRATTRADVEGATLQGHKPLAYQLGPAIDQTRSLGAILQRAAWNVIEIRLVVLAKVRGVRERHATLVAHPRDRSRCVEPARERNSDALADWKRGEDGSH